jgi:asparagine synthase (glutamine-hydrolysing)
VSAIAGIVNLDGQPVDKALLGAMVDSLAHRGTDGRGLWVAGSIGLGHRAHWTTPEASLESLPMEFGGRVVITGDVRLDNREDLLGSLPESGFLSQSTPDCALVLAAYEKWGENCVEHFLGDFAFAIWDKRAQKLFCARDHMGIKPFYYAAIPGRQFVFGTEIKAVLLAPGIADTINELRVADGYVHLVNDPVSTYYAHVSRLPAAHAMVVKNTISTRRYWRLNPDRELRLNSDRDYAEGFHTLFSQAVKSRMRSCHPMGSMLSGGLDSSSVTCIARDWLRAQGKPKLHTFSGVFNDVRECDERPYIRTVLEQGHCEPNFVVADSFSPLSNAEEMMWHLDAPLSSGNLYMTWNLYGKAGELGVKTILDGYDGDTTVSHGVGRLAELAGSRRWRDLAFELRRAASHRQGQSRLLWWWKMFSRYNPAAGRVNQVFCGVKRRLPGSRSQQGPRWDQIDFLNPDLAQRLGLEEIAQKRVPRHRSERESHLHMLEREVLTQGVEILDHISAAFNVEVRFPFMDIRLIEYCLSLPSDQKYRGGMTRFVLHSSMAGILPEKIQTRGGKSNLTPSFEKGLLKFERENVGKIILEEGGQLAEYVNLELVKGCLGRFQSGAASNSDFLALWRAIGLALWLRSRGAGSNQFILKRKEVK